MRKTIKIKGTEYPLGGQLRAMMIWESIFNTPFNLKLNRDYFIFYYCLLLAGDSDFSMSLKEFIAAVEDDFSIVTQFAAALMEAEKTKEIFDKAETKEPKKD